MLRRKPVTEQDGLPRRDTLQLTPHLSEAPPAEPMVQAGHGLPRAVDALRTATEPLTAREIAERVLAAAKVDNPKKAAVADLTGSILASLRNHVGKGIQRTNEGSPARWRLKEAAN
jgi:hypothetical protein